MNPICISKEFAHKCAEALVDKHNAIASRGNDSCTIISFRSLYVDLCKLGQGEMIATAIRPVNKDNVPLFVNANGEPIKR